MAKKMQIKRGVLSIPRYTNEIVTVDKRGRISLNKANRINVKRPRS